jgi:hypothetical protein
MQPHKVVSSKDCIEARPSGRRGIIRGGNGHAGLILTQNRSAKTAALTLHVSGSRAA